MSGRRRRPTERERAMAAAVLFGVGLADVLAHPKRTKAQLDAVTDLFTAHINLMLAGDVKEDGDADA